MLFYRLEEQSTYENKQYSKQDTKSINLFVNKDPLNSRRKKILATLQIILANRSMN